MAALATRAPNDRRETRVPGLYALNRQERPEGARPLLRLGQGPRRNQEQHQTVGDQHRDIAAPGAETAVGPDQYLDYLVGVEQRQQMAEDLRPVREPGDVHQQAGEEDRGQDHQGDEGKYLGRVAGEGRDKDAEHYRGDRQQPNDDEQRDQDPRRVGELEQDEHLGKGRDGLQGSEPKIAEQIAAENL